MSNNDLHATSPPPPCLAAPSLYPLSSSSCCSFSFSAMPAMPSIPTIPIIPTLPSTPSIPVECLSLILHCLLGDIKSLHSLLSVNSVFFQLTVPLLYASPFQLLDRLPYVPTRRLDLKARKQKLTQTLVDSAFDLALFPAFDPALAPLPSRSNTLCSSLSTPTNSTPALPHPPLRRQNCLQPMQRRVMTNYLYYYNYQHHKDLANIPEAPIAPGYDDMTWTRQDLQILMARYHPAGLREFGLGLEPSLLQLVPDLMCAHRLTRLELCAIKEETKLEPIIDFIATHNRQYGTLRDLKIQGSGPSHDPLRLVQCMDRPRLIDLSEWAQPVMRLDRIARDHLESLHLRLRERSPSEVTPIFLSTCPSLKILTMQVNKPDLFKPFIRDRFGTNSHPFWSELQSEDGQMSSRAFNTSKESLGHIPLSHMELSGEKSILVPCLMDIASAFQDTLQELVVNSWHFADHSDTKASLAWNHILPRLTRLELKGPIVLAFNLDTLVHCPSLRSLILDLPTLTHSVSGHKLASLASLRQLRELSLEGKWYIGDHLLDYLSDHLQSLERLSLEGCMGPTSNGLLKAIKKMKSLQWYCNTSVGACMRLGMTLALL